jgi:hypothetical protein
MTFRQHVETTLLWAALVLVGTMFGASVYQRISLIPEWGGDPPGSVLRFFGDPRAGQAIDCFWTVITGPTALLIVLATILNWPLQARRLWLALGAGLFFVMLAWTVVYFIPAGVTPLMVRGGAGLGPEAITQMARSWIFWDWFRMAGTLASYLFLLKGATVR